VVVFLSSVALSVSRLALNLFIVDGFSSCSVTRHPSLSVLSLAIKIPTASPIRLCSRVFLGIQFEVILKSFQKLKKYVSENIVIFGVWHRKLRIPGALRK
jgi:hypothetical protein